MNKNCCKHCRRIFKPNPRLKKQLYCNRKACQRARKTKWQKQKMTKLNCINTYKISTYALKLNVIELGNVFSL